MSVTKMVRRSVAIVFGIICIVLVAGLAGAFAYFINDQNSTVSSLNSEISALNSTVSSLNSIKNINVTNWPSQLLSNYVNDSGFFTLTPYPTNTSQTFYDLSVAGYRQVSVYVGFDTNLDVSMEIRVGMGDFTGDNIGGYNWATYYNISTVAGQGISPFRQTVNVQGPQLRIEVYNDESYSIDFVRIVVYATC